MPDRIKEIYQSYVNSKEFEKRAKGAEVDISWLEEKLCKEDMMKLEESITTYHVNNGRIFFLYDRFFYPHLFQNAVWIRCLPVKRCG